MLLINTVRDDMLLINTVRDGFNRETT